MDDFAFTDYFENEVLRKRPYLKKAWCIRVCQDPIKVEPQEHNRYRFWGEIEELEGRILRAMSRPSVSSLEISEGVVLDYDADGNITGIDIDNASRKIDLREVILNKIPAEVEAVHA
jgi:uncharacterized protein YuzE